MLLPLMLIAAINVLPPQTAAIPQKPKLPPKIQMIKPNTMEKPVGRTFSAGVALSKELPAGFYGRWSVTGRIIDTNNPYRFKERTSDIWILEKNNDIITLTNPVTTASASITVNEVRGYTAKFTRQEVASRKKETETPIITIDSAGNNFFGTNTLIIEKYRNGVLVHTDMVKYELTGMKISGPPIKELFGR